jgi:hypothetical protein
MGGVEHTVSGDFEAFCAQDGALVSLGAWPTWNQAADFYAQWSATHPRSARPQLSRAEMLAKIQRVRRSLEVQWDANSRAYELRGYEHSPDEALRPEPCTQGCTTRL